MGNSLFVRKRKYLDTVVLCVERKEEDTHCSDMLSTLELDWYRREYGRTVEWRYRLVAPKRPTSIARRRAASPAEERRQAKGKKKEPTISPSDLSLIFWLRFFAFFLP
jgi:hypothetical protein